MDYFAKRYKDHIMKIVFTYSSFLNFSLKKTLKFLISDGIKYEKEDVQDNQLLLTYKHYLLYCSCNNKKPLTYEDMLFIVFNSRELCYILKNDDSKKLSIDELHKFVGIFLE